MQRFTVSFADDKDSKPRPTVDVLVSDEGRTEEKAERRAISMARSRVKARGVAGARDFQVDAIEDVGQY